MRICSTITVLITAIAMQPVKLLACGYDNPQSIALGSLNWVYPDALYVRTAVSEAESAGLLPLARTGAQTGPLAFYRATAVMKSFGSKLADQDLANARIGISVVLIPQAMWTRFEIGSEGVVVQGHAEGPRPDDLVIVTEETVIQALVEGDIGVEAAEGSGLLRFYGNLGDLDKTRAILARTNRNDRALPVRFASPVPSLPDPAEDAALESPANF